MTNEIKKYKKINITNFVEKCKKHKKLILGIFLIFVFSYFLIWTVSQPFNKCPDEGMKWKICKYIAKHGSIPQGGNEEIREPDWGISYAFQPILTYMIGGVFVKIASFFTNDKFALVVAARLVSTISMTVSVYFVVKIAQKLLKGIYKYLFIVIIVFQPITAFLASYINNDSTAVLATTMIIYLWILGLESNWKTKHCILLGLSIGFCSLTYYNAYGYIVSCILLFVMFFLQKKESGGYSYDWKKMLKYGCFIAAVVLIGIGWWFIRSYIVLDGDLLGLDTREKMAIQYAIESVNPLTMQTYHSMGYTVFEMFRERYTLSGLFHSFVGAFGSMSIYGSIWLYRAYKVFFAAGIVGALLYLIRYKKRRKISGREWFFHINMLYCIFMPVFLTIYYAYTTDYQNQGRYLLPALIPLMYYMTKGIQKLSEISFRGRTFPRWLVNAGIAVCFLIIIGGAIEMVYVRALPVYLETGLVLE